MNEVQELWKGLAPLIENAIYKAFKENMPSIVAECERRIRDNRITCPAFNEFRRESDVEDFREMRQNYKKLRKKEITLYAMITIIINGAITAFIVRKFL